MLGGSILCHGIYYTTTCMFGSEVSSFFVGFWRCMWSKEVWYKYWYIYTTFFISAVVFFPAKIYEFDISMYFTIISAFCNLSCNCITQWTYRHNSCLLKHCISLKVKGLLCHYNCWFIVKCDWVHIFNLPNTHTVSQSCVNCPGSQKACQLMRVHVKLSILE